MNDPIVEEVRRHRMEHTRKFGGDLKLICEDLRRMIEHRRAELAKDIQDARLEFEEGRCRAATPSELIKEISS